MLHGLDVYGYMSCGGGGVLILIVTLLATDYSNSNDFYMHIIA